MVKMVEKELGYKLPKAYVDLMKKQNGGTPKATCHKMRRRTTWARDHIAIVGIYGLDKKKPYSLCGDFNTEFWIEEWGYPPIGIYICDCPSAGHDMIALDYRKCGRDGEPSVVHVDQESDYRINKVAKDFESFIRGLEREDKYI